MAEETRFDPAPLEYLTRSQGISERADILPTYDGIFKEFGIDRGIPRTASWLDHAALPFAVNQSPWNTCVSHSIATLMEFMANLRGDPQMYDAERFHQCEMGNSCENPLGSISEPLLASRDQGFPVESFDFEPGDDCHARRPTSVQTHRVWGIRDVYEVKRIVAEQSPVIVNMLAEWGRFSRYNDFSIYRDGTGVRDLSHAILIVGYDDDEKCWIIQNSFGTKWGQQGLGRIAYGHCKIMSGIDPATDERYQAFCLA